MRFMTAKMEKRGIFLVHGFCALYSWTSTGRPALFVDVHEFHTFGSRVGVPYPWTSTGMNFEPVDQQIR